jgi:hypothetical protein
VFATAAAAALGVAWPAAAARIDVANSDQLEAAVRNAGAGDTIVLAAGNYAPESTLELKVDVTITGPGTQGARGGPAGAVISGANIGSPYPPDIVDVDPGVTVTLANLSFRLADVQASAIDDSGTLTLDDSELSQNNSNAALVVEDGASATVRDSTIGGNVGAGADVFGSATFVNATVADNRSAGVFNEPGSDVALTNTIVARNGDGTTYSSDCFSAVDASTSSLDDDGSCGANIEADAKLGPLTLNGGPTATMALEADSPAIDAGAAASCSAADQRFAPRVGACDIGAFEFGASATPAASPPPVQAGGGATTAAAGAPSAAPAAAPHPATPAPAPAVTTITIAGGPKPTAKPAAKPARLAASGTIRVGSGRASFQLRAVAGKRAGLLVFADPAAHVRLRATALTALQIDRKHGTAKIRGTALVPGTKRRVRFVVTVSSSKPARFEISLAGGYARSGRLATGRVSIAV